MKNSYRLIYKEPTTNSAEQKIKYTSCCTLYDIAILHILHKARNTAYEPVEIVSGANCSPCDMTMKDAEAALNEWTSKHTAIELVERIARLN